MASDLKQQNALQAQKIKEQQQEIAALKEKLRASKPTTPGIARIKHSAEFWRNVAKNCYRRAGPFGTDSLKTMIKSGKMTVNDVDANGETLLLNATNYGAYEFIQFLVNNGADLDATNLSGSTALDVARDCTYPNIEVYEYKHGHIIDTCVRVHATLRNCYCLRR